MPLEKKFDKCGINCLKNTLETDFEKLTGLGQRINCSIENCSGRKIKKNVVPVDYVVDKIQKDIGKLNIEAENFWNGLIIIGESSRNKLEKNRLDALCIK